MNPTLRNLMNVATRLTRAGRLADATAAIQRALRGRSDAPTAHAARTANRAATDAATVSVTQSMTETVADQATDAFTDAVADAAKETGFFGAGTGTAPPQVLEGCVFEADPRPAGTVPAGAGEFSSGSFSHAALTRDYKLYLPPGHAGRALPLVVMLHGCTQDPDDFARGTDMNERAREQGFVVLYPAQTQAANPSRCWNWFKHNHQRRGSGEAALLGAMARSVVLEHGLDARRVFIAGLSAGGAMAAIVADTHPEIFSAVGVHSGLAPGAASNVMEALTAMRHGASGSTLGGAGGMLSGAGSMLGGAGGMLGAAGGMLGAAGSRLGGAGGGVGADAALGGADAAPLHGSARMPVPTIVFHGDQDQTVHPSNAEHVVAAVLDSAHGTRQDADPGSTAAHVEHGVCAGGRSYTRAIHHAGNGNAVAEHWLIHGAGHAWSGGQAAGSYTDPAGPDATGEMLRFFFDQPQTQRH